MSDKQPGQPQVTQNSQPLDYSGEQQSLQEPSSPGLNSAAKYTASNAILKARTNPASLEPKDVLTLQRLIGNKAITTLLSNKAQKSKAFLASGSNSIQRTVSINPVKKYEITLATFYQKLQVHSAALPKNFVADIKPIMIGLNTQDHNANDIPTLRATILTQYRTNKAIAVNRGLPGEANVIAAIESSLGEAMVNPKQRPDKEAAEISLAVELLGKSTIKTRSRASHNTLPTAQLSDKVSAQVAAQKALVVAANAAFDGHVFNTLSVSIRNNISGLINHKIPNVRDINGNLEGWLPAVAVPANQTNYGDHRDYWVAYLLATKPSPFIEIHVGECGPGLGGVRLIYDCISDLYYFTVHYESYQGWNPFYLLI